MGYFSNGTEGASFEEHYCARCIYRLLPRGCPVWAAHQIFNYQECDNDKSPLHYMITPGTKENGWEQTCIFFTEDKPENWREIERMRQEEAGQETLL